MATARVVEHEEEDEDTVEVVDNTLNLRGRRVEREETDRDLMTHVGVWGHRTASETRTGERRKEKPGEDFFL